MIQSTTLPVGWILAVVAGIASLAVAAAALAAWQAHRRAARLEDHYRLLMTGADGTDMAAALAALARRLDTAEDEVRRLEGARRTSDKRLARALAKVGFLRYKAFEDAGGDQSFTVALLDAADNGVVLTGLHGRGGVRVYAKPVASGKAPYTLTAEEERAIAEAGRLAAPEATSD